MRASGTAATRAALARALAAAALGLCAPAAPGCGRVAAGEAHALSRALVPPDGAFRLWYLTPPWELRDNTAARATLVVPAEFGAFLDGAVPPILALTVETRAGTTPDAVLAAAAAQARAAGATVVYGPRPVRMALGVVGVEGAFRDARGTVRAAAAPLADGRTVVLVFSSGRPIEHDPDVGGMIADFEARPPGTGP